MSSRSTQDRSWQLPLPAVKTSPLNRDNMSTCTSSPPQKTSCPPQKGAGAPARLVPPVGDSHGFSLIELLVGLVLSLMLALAIAPLWTTASKLTVEGADRVMATFQARTAVARLERDLRLASALGGVGLECAPVVEADEHHLVVVTRSAANATPELVEWELVGGSLMRRRGPWAGIPAGGVSHSLFNDHKTMLEGLAAGGSFAYLSGARVLAGNATPERDAITEVVIQGAAIVGARAEVPGALVPFRATMRVAR
jgi:prepilin-type N-terminal cleavage/methylation domain-containing protein